MSTRFLRTVTLAVLAACSTLALADTPTRVGRISLSQGQVGISGEQGDETSAVLVNWPVTSHNQVTTGRDGRTEIRIGSTAVRLDADSALDVTELDDDSLRLHLHYGSANIRVRNADVLRGFTLSTPQGEIRMLAAGQFRVDAGRRQDSTEVSVYSGVAEVDGGGSRLTVRAGKRVEIGQDDIRTGLALRDSFDEWSLLRDLRDERSQSARYVTNEMTGYEDLDQNGVWREDNDYGPLWSPRSVPLGWAPYRDGRWTYVQPWGWTWVDNAPWGYAPFHYGRWVEVNQRWCWAPGRNISRVIWSPALVGWVGGNNWNANFGSGSTRRAVPATGWYPLTPHDTYVPTYRMAHDNLRYLNRNVGSAQPDIRGRMPYQHRDDQPHAGLTVVPHDQFRQRGTVVVPTAPKGTVSPAQFVTGSAMPAVPPAPQITQRDHSRDWGRVERSDRADGPRNGAGQASMQQVGGDVARRVSSFSNDARRQQTGTPAVVTPMPAAVAPSPAIILSVPSQPVTAPANRDERVSRFRRGDMERDPDVERERRARGAESVQQQAQGQQQLHMQQAQQQQAQQQAQQQQAQQQLRMQQAQMQQQQMQQAQMQQAQMQQQQMQQAQMQQAQLRAQQAPQPQAQPVQQARPQPQPQPQSAPVEQRPVRESPGVAEKMRRAKEDANDRR